jgi:hypothetical protein
MNAQNEPRSLCRACRRCAQAARHAMATSGHEIDRREICTGCTAPRETPAPPPGPADTHTRLYRPTAIGHPRPGLV